MPYSRKATTRATIKGRCYGERFLHFAPSFLVRFGRNDGYDYYVLSVVEGLGMTGEERR
jgi:hypothetical protein